VWDVLEWQHSQAAAPTLEALPAAALAGRGDGGGERSGRQQLAWI